MIYFGKSDAIRLATQNRIPVILKMLLPLLAGVVLHFYSGFNLPFGFVLLTLGLMILLTLPILSLNKWLDKLFGVLVLVFFFQAGLYLSQIHDSSRNKLYFEKSALESESIFEGVVLEPPQEKANSVKCVLNIQSIDGKKVMGKTLIYLEKDSAALHSKYGDHLRFKTHFNPIKANGNPHEFDYARYLRIHDVHSQAYVKSSNWAKTGNSANPFFRSVYQLRNYLSDELHTTGISEKNFMVANALLLGQKDFLDKDVLRSFSSAGAMHVLAVSGLHVGIIMLILAFFLTPLKKMKRGKVLYLLALLGGIWFYAIITGLSPSVLRASVMFSFIIFGKELQRDASIYQSIMVSAFLLILLEPYIIFQVGFQLSYLAVLGIVYLQPKIVNLFYVQNFILNKAWQITAVSIAAQIATFPLGLYYFHQFPNFFMISNLLVIPLAFVLLIVGISYFVLHLVPFVSDLILYLFDGLLSLLNWGVEWIQALPYSIVWGISIHWYEVLLLYLAILLGAIAFTKKRVRLLFYSLTIAVILLCLNIVEKMEVDSSRTAFIYNVNKELAVDVFYGNENTFYSSKKLMKDEEKLLFHVKHNWFYRTGQEQPTVWKDISQESVLRMGEKSFLILNDTTMNSYAEHLPIVDVVVIHDCQYVPAEIISYLKNESIQVVVGDGVGYGARKYIVSNLKKSRLHILKEQGFYSMPF